MENVKKIVVFILSLTIVFVMQISVEATEKLTNSNGIKMTEEEYSNLLDLGFTELAIDQMEKEVFKEHKDLIVRSKVDTTKYYEIKETPQDSEYMTFSQSTDDTSYISTELSEDEYFEKVKLAKEAEEAKEEFSTFSSVDSTRTSYRRLTTSIQNIGPTSKDYRVHNKFIWDIIPKTRSYDVLSISLDTTFSALRGSNYGQQLWSTTHPIHGGLTGGNASYTSGSSTWTKGNSGYGVKMNLRDDYSTARVVGLEGYMYYKIVRNSSTVPYYLNAYGNYSHKKNTSNNSYSYGLSFGGPAISWSGITSSSFDSITTHAQIRY